jgi:hypothetical protein
MWGPAKETDSPGELPPVTMDVVETQAQAGMSSDSATSVWPAQVPEPPVALLAGRELLVRPALQEPPGPRKQLAPSWETWRVW